MCNIGIHGGATHELTGIDAVPITKQHPPPVDLDKYISQPWLPRACAAVSREMPHGSPERANEKTKTVMQQHADFFDLNKDGILTIPETFNSFRMLGFNYFVCILAVCIQ